MVVLAKEIKNAMVISIIQHLVGYDCETIHSLGGSYLDPNKPTVYNMKPWTSI